MSDLIDRQAAIDAILRITNCKSVRELFEYNQEHHLTEMWSGGVNDAIDAVIGVESATDNNVGTKLSTNLAEVGTDLISRAEAQTELQLSARRYTVAHEAHGEGRVVWSEDLISVSDAMDVLRKIPSAQPKLLQPWEVLAAQAVLSHPAEPKKGRWIGKYPITSVCSECGFLIHDSKVKVFAFCPNCGCRMDGGEQ